MLSQTEAGRADAASTPLMPSRLPICAAPRHPLIPGKPAQQDGPVGAGRSRGPLPAGSPARPKPETSGCGPESRPPPRRLTRSGPSRSRGTPAHPAPPVHGAGEAGRAWRCRRPPPRRRQVAVPAAEGGSCWAYDPTTRRCPPALRGAQPAGATRWGTAGIGRTVRESERPLHGRRMSPLSRAPRPGRPPVRSPLDPRPAVPYMGGLRAPDRMSRGPEADGTRTDSRFSEEWPSGLRRRS